MPAADATYRPLKAFVASRSNSRLRLHGALRDRMIEVIVEEWPVGCPHERLEEVLSARMKIRLREQYGSVVAMFLLSILVNALVKLIIEWWFDRDSHRALMVGWAEQASRR